MASLVLGSPKTDRSPSKYRKPNDELLGMLLADEVRNRLRRLLGAPTPTLRPGRIPTLLGRTYRRLWLGGRIGIQP